MRFAHVYIRKLSITNDVRNNINLSHLDKKEPGGVVLSIGLGRDVRLEAPNIGLRAYRADQRQIWGLVELIFLTKCSLSELIFDPNLGFLNGILADPHITFDSILKASRSY